MRTYFIALWILTFFVVSGVGIPGRAMASDHADPAWLSNDKQEANLTGLFFFPKGDRYIIVLGARPSLTERGPYNLKPYLYRINIDTHSSVSFKASEDFQCNQLPLARGNADIQAQNGSFCRYGGTVVDPSRIAADITFSFSLNPDASLRGGKFQIGGSGIDPRVGYQIFDAANLASERRDPTRIWVYTGVRDDPFIFPKFFNTNIIAMVLSVPKSAFTVQSTDLLLWGESFYASSMKKIDHVGRSNRTQLGRFDILNTLEPYQHVAALHDAAGGRAHVQTFLKEVLRPLSNLNQLSGFVLRSYDYAPDVMIFTTRYPPTFPNGRQLTDDVAETTCQFGDCPLHENSYIDSKTFQRAVVNDRPFLDDFPYLAEHWPWRPQPFPGSPWHWFSKHLLWQAVVLIGLFMLIRRAWRIACVRLRARTVD